MDFNKAIIAGRLTAAPELKVTQSGQSVANIRVATNRTWTDKTGAKQESVQFHSVVVWGKQAEVANAYLQKGSTVLIEGRLETREWTDKQNVKHYATEIICENFQLGPRPVEIISATPGATIPPEKPAAQKPAKEEPYDGDKFEKLFPRADDEIKPEDIPF